MNKIPNFLQDDTGNYSLMRLMCFGCFLVAVTICIVGLIQNNLDRYHISIAEWLGFAFTGKVGQKIVENK